MGKGSVSVQKAKALGEPIAKELGLSLWDVRFEKEGASWFLRYIIDKETPVTFDDCEAFSRRVDKLLDEEDFIEQSYYLDVSSPGIERELKRDEHFEKSIGKEVKVSLIRPDENGNKLYIGLLNRYENKSVYIFAEGKELVFELSAVSSVKLNDDKFFGGND